MTPNDKLPQAITDQVNEEADKYGFVVPYDGSNKFYNEDKVKGYQAGATAWAQWKVRFDELQEQAQYLTEAMEKVKLRLNWINNGHEIDIIQKALDRLQQFIDGTKGEEVGNG